MPSPDPIRDGHKAQACRAANYLETRPASTVKEIDAACDMGSGTKVLSEMRRMGYGLARGWRWEPRPGGQLPRRVRTYTLLYRPGPKAQSEFSF